MLSYEERDKVVAYWKNIPEEAIIVPLSPDMKEFIRKVKAEEIK